VKLLPHLPHLRACPRPRPPRPGPALGPEVYEPVGRLYDVHIVLDHDDRIALLHQLIEHAQELAYVFEMQACRRLVPKYTASGRSNAWTTPMPALFAAPPPRQCGAGLAQLDIPQPDVDQSPHVASNDRLVGKILGRLFARQVQDSAMFLPLNVTVEGVAVVTSALAHLARHVHVRKKVHLDLDRSVARTRLAAAAADIEREAPRLVATPPCLVGSGEEPADVVEHPRVGGGVAPGVRPIGDWSTSTTLSKASMPSTRRWRPGTSLDLYTRCMSARSNISLTSVDFPEPDTPLTTTKQPSGNSTSMSRRLCSFAPRTTSQPLGSRRRAVQARKRLPERYCPVRDSLLRNSSFTVPDTTIRPPCSPLPGRYPPRGRRADGLFVVLHDDHVLPRSRRRMRVSISLRLSRWCRPIEGSSNTYRTPTNPLPICEARRMRCASPPARVPALRLRLR